MIQENMEIFVELLSTILKVGFAWIFPLLIVPVLILAERRGSAFIQDRSGPNRANVLGLRVFGLIQNIPDVIKLITKEGFFPKRADKVLFLLAPFIVMSTALMSFAVIPLWEVLEIGIYKISGQGLQFNAGIIYVLAVTSLSVYGVVLAGWSSNNKFALLGGVRSSAQMISYEIPMGLAILSLIMWVGSPRLEDIVLAQQGLLFGIIPKWGVVVQPLAALLFIIAVFAECNRTPFDLVEADSEIVAGFFLEYSSFKFALFYMGEYVSMIVGSALIATLFFGGYSIPFVSTDMLRDGASDILFVVLALGIPGSLALSAFAYKYYSKNRNKWGDLRDLEGLYYSLIFVIGAIVSAIALFFLEKYGLHSTLKSVFTVAVQFATLIAKTLFFCWMFIWVRWTIPRFRYDQLMKLGWKIMLPLALINIVITGIVLYLWDKQ